MRIITGKKSLDIFLKVIFIGTLLGPVKLASGQGHSSSLGPQEPISHEQVSLPYPPCIEWQKTYGDCGYNSLGAASPTRDGGYVLIGTSAPNSNCQYNPSGQEYTLVKTCPFGEVEWMTTIGGDRQDLALTIDQTTDGGYIVGGLSNSRISGDKTEAPRGDHDYWILKLSADGTIEWQRTLGGDQTDWLIKTVQTHDDGYVLGGFTKSDLSGDKSEENQGGYDFWIIKLSSNGSVEWQNSIGGAKDDILSDVAETRDSGYLLGGYSFSDISGDKTENSRGNRDGWLLKLSRTGDIEWQRTIGGFSGDEISAVFETANGEIIIGAWTSSGISGEKTDSAFGGTDYWIFKLTSTGAIDWQHTFGGFQDDVVTCASPTSDGGILIGGYSGSGVSGNKTEFARGAQDYWVLKLNAAGGIEWQKTIGSARSDILKSVFENSEGDVILAGNSEFGISRDKTEAGIGYDDFWVVKLDLSRACLRCISATNHGSGVAATDLWTDEANWSLNHIPKTCEHVIIDQSDHIFIEDQVEGKCQTLEIKLGASLTVNLGGQINVIKYPTSMSTE